MSQIASCFLKYSRAQRWTLTTGSHVTVTFADVNIHPVCVAHEINSEIHLGCNIDFRQL